MGGSTGRGNSKQRNGIASRRVRLPHTHTRKRARHISASLTRGAEGVGCSKPRQNCSARQARSPRRAWHLHRHRLPPETIRLPHMAASPPQDGRGRTRSLRRDMVPCPFDKHVPNTCSALPGNVRSPKRPTHKVRMKKIPFPLPDPSRAEIELAKTDADARKRVRNQMLRVRRAMKRLRD